MGCEMINLWSCVSILDGARCLFRATAVERTTSLVLATLKWHSQNSFRDVTCQFPSFVNVIYFFADWVDEVGFTPVFRFFFPVPRTQPVYFIRFISFHFVVSFAQFVCLEFKKVNIRMIFGVCLFNISHSKSFWKEKFFLSERDLIETTWDLKNNIINIVTFSV